MIANIFFIFFLTYFIICNLFVVVTTHALTDPVELIDTVVKSGISDVLQTKDGTSLNPQPESMNGISKADIHDDEASTEIAMNKRSTIDEQFENSDESKSDHDAENTEVHELTEIKQGGTDNLEEKSGDDTTELKSDTGASIEQNVHETLDDELKSNVSTDEEPTLDKIGTETSGYKSATIDALEERTNVEEIELISPDNIVPGARRMLTNVDTNSRSDAFMEITKTDVPDSNNLNSVGGSRRSFTNYLPQQIYENPPISVLGEPFIDRITSVHGNLFPVTTAPLSTGLIISKSASSNSGPLGRSITSQTRVVHDGVEVLNNVERNGAPWNNAKFDTNSYPYSPGSFSLNYSTERQKINSQNNIDFFKKMTGSPKLSIHNVYSAENLMRPFPNMFTRVNHVFPNNFNHYISRPLRSANNINHLNPVSVS